MKTIATTTLTGGENSRYTLAVYSNCKGMVRSIDVLEKEPQGTGPRPYQILDLLVRILPRKLYTKGVKVEFGYNPTQHSKLEGHPCLIVHQGDKEKRYRLDHTVTDGWAVAIPAAHLRGMVRWWRTHREEFDRPPLQWGYWRCES